MNDTILSFINTTKDYFTDPVIVNFNESLSLFSGLERIKLDPTSRDTTAAGEGGLNKFAKSEKDKRSAKVLDNLDINLKHRFTTKLI